MHSRSKHLVDRSLPNLGTASRVCGGRSLQGRHCLLKLPCALRIRYNLPLLVDGAVAHRALAHRHRRAEATIILAPRGLRGDGALRAEALAEEAGEEEGAATGVAARGSARRSESFWWVRLSSHLSSSLTRP